MKETTCTPPPPQPAPDLQAGDGELDSATRSYMAWAKTIEDGKFDAQAYAKAVEQEKLSKIACVPTPTPQTFIGPAPTPTPTATPPPSLSGKDVVQGICEAADAVDPLMPNPETFGGPDIGDMIDQAYIWQQSVPVIPQSEPVFRVLVRAPITVAKAFKDGPSTIVSFICQQRDGAGPYYELFPIDQKAQAAKDSWNGMDTKQKVFTIGITVLALLIAIPLIVMLVG